MAGRMSWDQEADIKAAIMKAARKEIMMKFPWVVKAMNEFDPCTRDLKYLVVLD